MRRIKAILAVVALVVAMMVFAAPAMAESEISSSGGSFVGTSSGDIDSGGGDTSVGNVGDGEIDIDSSGGDISLG